MKKIVLLSLALFSVAALRAEGPADWAQYGRYDLQNAVLDRPVEVGCMVNSFTDGWIRVDPDFFVRNVFLDRGSSWQSTVQMLARFRSDVIDLKPQVVVILAGINDIARNISTRCFGYLDAPPASVGAQNWITPPFEFDEFYSPSKEWIMDAIHAQLLPLENYVPTTSVTDVERMRRLKAGVKDAQ